MAAAQRTLDRANALLQWYESRQPSPDTLPLRVVKLQRDSGTRYYLSQAWGAPAPRKKSFWPSRSCKRRSPCS